MRKAVLFFLSVCLGAPFALDHRYLLFHGDQHDYAQVLNGVADSFPAAPGGNMHAGAAVSFYCMATDTATLAGMLRNLLRLSATREVPVFICLDVEQWMNNHPGLWNWFDPGSAGYDPRNADNVEWSGWGRANAIKISWRNWGYQMRVPPAPNLMSPEYRAIARAHYARFIPIIMDWYRGLSADKKYLFAGLKVGWESGIGLNAAYHPNGNHYYETWPNDASHDPPWSAQNSNPPAYGFQQIGYAALTTGGFKSSGSITEEDLAAVVHRHVGDLCGVASSLGVPREKMFTHVVPWMTVESNYQASYNAYSCPGWSAYTDRTAGIRANALVDGAVKRALAEGAPAWGMVEMWLAATDYNSWSQFLRTGFAGDPSCRLVSLYNWKDAVAKAYVLKAARDVLPKPAPIAVRRGRGPDGTQALRWDARGRRVRTRPSSAAGLCLER